MVSYKSTRESRGFWAHLLVGGFVALSAACGPVTQSRGDAALSSDGQPAGTDDGEAPDSPDGSVSVDASDVPEAPQPALKVDGEPCGAGTECASGTCGQFFHDADGDGHPGEAGHLCGGSPPAGWSASATDCCDSDANAHPGQTRYFTRARTGCGGYDYNCNGTSDRQYTSVLSCADFDPSTGVPDKWYQSAPACGVSAPLGAPQVTCCPPSCTGIQAGSTNRTQGCR